MPIQTAMARSNEEYWVSSSINMGPLQSVSPDICLLSLVLEKGISSKVSGVRVVIIDPEDHPRWQWRCRAAVRFRECPDTRGLFRHEGLEVPERVSFFFSPHRKVYDLASARGGHRVTREHIKARALGAETATLKSNADQSTTLDIVLRLTPVDVEAAKLANGLSDLYPPRYYLKIHPAKLKSDDQNHDVAFDCTYQVCPDNPTLSLVLECTESLVEPDWRGEDEVEPIDVLGFSFNIFPLDTISNTSGSEQPRRQGRANKLPPEILLAIVRETLPPPALVGQSDVAAHWQRTIRSCALVCKSWVFLIRAFFENVGTQSYPVKGFLPFVKSVIAQPFMGNFIKEFSEGALLDVYKKTQAVFDGDPLPHPVVDGIKSLLHRTPLITTVSVDQRLLSVILADIARLSMVEDFAVDDLPWYRGWSVPMVTFEQIYHTTLNWKELRRIEISTPLSVTGFEITQLPFVPYALEDLMLRRGRYGTHQILSLLSSSRTSLTSLVLLSVSGINNSGLLQILLHISPNLEHLTIEKGPFPASNEVEEKAFDVLVSHALNLKTVQIDAENVSVACISRKAPQTQINEEDCHSRTSASIRINLSNGVVQWPWSIVDLHSALSNTGWTTIFLTGPSGQLYTADEQKQLRRTAAARAVDLRFR